MTLGFPDRQIIADLTAKMFLDVEAVRFMTDKPFIFTSGWASPVYTDCRRLISFPRVRRTLMGTLRRRRPGDPDKALAKARDPEAARMAAVALLARRDFASGELRQKRIVPSIERQRIDFVSREHLSHRCVLSLQ